jgi:threonine/homoserine/homoserine lactone efflux protein
MGIPAHSHPGLVIERSMTSTVPSALLAAVSHSEVASFLLKGLVIGFSIAAPVGPIGLLSIRRSLERGWGIGFATGLGAATADAAYGCVAGFGLTAISSFLIRQRLWLGLIGGAFLCFLGVHTFLSKPANRPMSAQEGGGAVAYLSTLFLTLTNPATSLSFVAVFAGFGVGAGNGYAQALVLVLGVFLGSAVWWLMLSTGVTLFRSRVTSQWMQGVNRVSGALLLAFGVYAVFKAMRL